MKTIVTFLLAAFYGAALAAEKPNVVVIFIDDMGYGDIGPYGATKQKTPQLDRMAAEGMKLTSFYAAPVCSVSRAQLLTGCYGPRIDVPAVYGPGGARGLNPKEYTIAERLKPLGYATTCIGKWHVGDQPEFLPTRQGFDHYFGIPYSNDMQAKSTESGERVVPLLRDDKVAELLTDEQQGRIVERYTDEAVRFITEHKDQPFFLYLPHTAIHTPIYPGEKFRGKSANGRVGDWIEEIDWSTGRVLDTLRELKLAENTLVIFTTDNGPWLVKGADSGSAGPLRGGKGSTWEGGVRVPTIAWWPGKIAPNTSVDAIAGTIDLLPTAVSVAGGSVPPHAVSDGRDPSPPPPRRARGPLRRKRAHGGGEDGVGGERDRSERGRARDRALISGPQSRRAAAREARAPRSCSRPRSRPRRRSTRTRSRDRARSAGGATRLGGSSRPACPRP